MTDATDHKCMHPLGQCKIVKTSQVIPNGFNIVLDKDDPSFCHVLQFFDITKHNWYCEGNSICSFTVESTPLNGMETLRLEVNDNQYAYHNNTVEFEINKQDVIALARHFKLTNNDMEGR